LLRQITEEGKIQVEKMATLQEIVNEIIDILKFNIVNKKGIRAEKREKIKDFGIILSNIFSVAALFFSLG